jgi:hypothetical protein
MLGGINSISPSSVNISYRAYFGLHTSYIKFFGVLSPSMDLQFLAIGVYGDWAFIVGTIRSLLMWTQVLRMVKLFRNCTVVFCSLRSTVHTDWPGTEFAPPR